VSIALRSLSDLNVTDALDQGALHIAIGVFGWAPARFERAPLDRIENVWAMRGDHPAAAGSFDLETLALYPHLELRITQRPNEEDLERNALARATAQLESYFAERGLARRIGAVTGHLLAVGPLVARSDLLAFIPTRLARHFAISHGLKSALSPYETEPMPLVLLSHRTLGSHPAIVWFRAQLHEVGRQEGFEAS
jgi:DNA-binding transcriptional LysR family regulator